MAKFQDKLIADGYCDNRGAGFCATATKLPKPVLIREIVHQSKRVIERMETHTYREDLCHGIFNFTAAVKRNLYAIIGFHVVCKIVFVRMILTEICECACQLFLFSRKLNVGGLAAL